MTTAEPYILIMTLIFKDGKDKAFTNMNWSGAAVESVEMKSKSSCEIAARSWISTIKQRGITAKTNCVRMNPTSLQVREDKIIQEAEDRLELGLKACADLKWQGKGTYNFKPLHTYENDLDGRVEVLRRMGFSNVNPKISQEWFVKIFRKRFNERKHLLHKGCDKAIEDLKLILEKRE